MKKIFTAIFLILISFSFASCELDSIDIKVPFSDNAVKQAYVDSIIEFEETAITDNVEVNEIYKTIDSKLSKDEKVRIVNVTSSYDVVPYKIYREYVEKLEFNYGKFSYYGYYENKLYTIGELYKKRIIDMDLVCELFSIYSEAKTILTYHEYTYMINKISAGNYKIDRYFGKCENLSAVTLTFSANLDVTEPVRVGDVYFEFPHPNTSIRLVNGIKEIKFTDSNLLSNVSKETIYELFSMYTKSKPVNEELINMLFTPIVPIYQKYVPDFDIDDLYLEYYNGEVNGAHVFTFGSNVWLAGKVDKDDDSIASSLLYGTGYDFIYYENNVYRKTDAINMGIITEDQIKELKYGN